MKVNKQNINKFKNSKAMKNQNAHLNLSTSKTLQLIEQNPDSLFALTATLIISLNDYIEHLDEYRYIDANNNISPDFNAIIENLGQALSTKQPFLISCNPDDYVLEIILPDKLPERCSGLTIEELEYDPDGLDCLTISCPRYPANLYINLG